MPIDTPLAKNSTLAMATPAAGVASTKRVCVVPTPTPAGTAGLKATTGGGVLEATVMVTATDVCCPPLLSVALAAST